jgi:hypothetical protein
MAERKRLVMDANSLIRASLGVRLRVLIADCVSEVDFDVAEANAAEAAGYIGELATPRGLDPQIRRWARGLWRSPYLTSRHTLTSAQSPAARRAKLPGLGPVI